MHFLGYTYPQHSQPQKSHNVELKFNRSLLITCIDGESPDLLNLFLMTYHSEQTSTRHYPKSWMHTGVFLLLLFFFFLAMPHGMWDLNSLPGIDSTGCAVEMQNPNHWTTREFLNKSHPHPPNLSGFQQPQTWVSHSWFCGWTVPWLVSPGSPRAGLQDVWWDQEYSMFFQSLGWRNSSSLE